MWSFRHLKALQLINKKKCTKGVIYSDSLPCLRLIGNKSNNNPLIHSIQEAAHKLQSQNCEVILVWVPSHQGTKGNENADAEAWLAATKPLHPEARLAPTEVMYFIHHKITEHWNNMWNVPVTKLHLVRDNIKDRSYNRLDRSDQCVINSLRFHHTNLTNIHVIIKTNPTKCPRCDVV